MKCHPGLDLGSFSSFLAFFFSFFKKVEVLKFFMCLSAFVWR